MPSIIKIKGKTPTDWKFWISKKLESYVPGVEMTEFQKELKHVLESFYAACDELDNR